MINYQSGFSLIELLIVIAIMSILIASSFPSYSNYTRRAHYLEVIQATQPYKLGVQECYQIIGELNSCNAGSEGIPPSFIDQSSPKEKALVHTINVQQGIITVTPHERYGIKPSDQYILEPIVQSHRILWKAQGNGVANGYAK